MRQILHNFRNMNTIILAILLIWAVCIVPVSAVNVMGAKYSNEIVAGGSDTHQMTVSIGADEKPADFQVDVMGFGQAPDKGYRSLAPANDLSPYSGRQFITISNSTIHLEPGKSQIVTATIKLPSNAGSGGRYAIISIHSVSSKGEVISTGVNVPVFITISGTKPTVTGSIQKIETGEVTIGQPISITTTFKNTGNYHYYGTINSVNVLDSTGKSIGTFSSSPSPIAIIPENTVQYTITPETGALSEGTYTVESSISLGDGTILDKKTGTFEIKKPYIPPVTESTITLLPGTQATLKSPDTRISVIFPQGSVLGEVNVTLKPYTRSTLSPAPQNVQLGATSFEISGLSGLLNKDATLKVTYSDDDLKVAGGDTSHLKLAYFDAAQNVWVILPTQVNVQDKTLTSATNHLGVWAVMVSSTITGSTPVGGAPSAETTQSPISLTMIIAALMLSGIVATYRARKKK